MRFRVGDRGFDEFDAPRFVPRSGSTPRRGQTFPCRADRAEPASARSFDPAAPNERAKSGMIERSLAEELD